MRQLAAAWAGFGFGFAWASIYQEAPIAASIGLGAVGIGILVHLGRTRRSARCDTISLIGSYLLTAVWAQVVFAKPHSWLTIAPLAIFSLIIPGVMLAADTSGTASERTRERQPAAATPIDMPPAGTISEHRYRDWLRMAIHDLNQPLRTAILLVTALDMPGRRRISLGRKQVDLLKYSLDNMSLQLDSVASLSGLGIRVMQPLHAVRVGRFLEDVTGSFTGVADAKDLMLTTRGRDELLKLDSGLLNHVVGNLIANAIDATKSGGILVACRKRQTGVLIEVRDTGPGFDRRSSTRKRRGGADTRTGLPEHMGLGLNIVRDLCTTMGLTFALDSQTNRGTTAQVHIPARNIEEKRRRLLVAGSCTATTDRIGHLLESWGFSARLSSDWVSDMDDPGLSDAYCGMVLVSSTRRFPKGFRSIIAARRETVSGFTAILASAAQLEAQIWLEHGLAKTPLNPPRLLRSTLFRLLPKT